MKLFSYPNGRLVVNAGGLLILASVVVFVLAALGVGLGDVELVAAGLALFAAGHLV